MYESYYGLRERPFNLSPDPRFLYLSPQHREALGNLKYGVMASRAITLLTGEAGTGKTTVLHSALAEAEGQTSYVVLSNPTLTRGEFVTWMASTFGLSADASASKGLWLLELEAVLKERQAKGSITALVIDEAQSLPLDLLEEVRLLSNMETDSEKLLPIVLLGQPELADRLNQPELRQLKQRVALRCELKPFDLDAAARYIGRRITCAGGTPSTVFTRDAVIAVHQAANGIPRTMNVLCDNALLSGFAAAVRPVGRKIIHEVCNDFAFGVGEPSPAVEPASPSLESDSAPATASDESSTAAAPDLFAASSGGGRRLSLFRFRN
jgi:general secretion pathway protein A